MLLSNGSAFRAGSGGKTGWGAGSTFFFSGLVAGFCNSWRGGATHFVFANKNTPWCEMFLPWPGGPKDVYERFEQEHQITRGPEEIYMRPPDRPGFGFELRPA